MSVHSRLNWNCWFLRRGEKRCARGNTCPKTGENLTNNKLNQGMLSMPGFDPGPHQWEASALITAPPLLPIAIFEALEQINTGTFDVHHALILKIMKWNWKWKWKYIFAPPRLISSIWNFINWPLWTEIIMKVNSLHNATWQWQKINILSNALTSVIC